MLTHCVTVVFQHLSNLKLKKVHQDGFGEVFKSIGCRQVRNQTPLLEKHTISTWNIITTATLTHLLLLFNIKKHDSHNTLMDSGNFIPNLIYSAAYRSLHKSLLYLNPSYVRIYHFWIFSSWTAFTSSLTAVWRCVPEERFKASSPDFIIHPTAVVCFIVTWHPFP